MLRSVLFILFFLSGCAALIYQIVWERMLFTMLGVDIQSVTIVVSVFMLGLGCGGLLGGAIADWKPQRLLLFYVLIELGVAAFGYISSPLIYFLNTHFTVTNLFMTAGISFIVLLFPTLLMGATFPILVRHINLLDQNVGRNVGGLYFANTLGGAVGVYCAGFLFLQVMDLDGEIMRAVLLNVLTAMTALVLFRSEA